MTNREMLRGLEELIVDDDDLDEPARLVDVLDQLGVLGLDGAAEAYQRELGLEKIHAGH